MFLQVALSFARTDAESDAAAFEQWRQAALPSAQLADLETPEQFDRASADVTVEDVIRKVRSSAEIDRHIDWLRQDAEMGFSRLYLHNVARAHQERFIEVCGARVIPALAGAAVG